MSELLGVVLAGGRSRRFGSAKALAQLEGRTLAEWSAAALAPVARRVVVIANESQITRAMDVPTRPDAHPGLGAPGGLLTALLWAREERLAGTLVLACDLPLASSALLALLASRLPEDRPVVPWSPGPWGVEPLCAAYPVAALGPVEGALAPFVTQGEPVPRSLSMERLLEGLRPARVHESEVRSVCDPRRAFLNVNEPEDLEAARKLLARTEAESHGDET